MYAWDWTADTSLHSLSENENSLSEKKFAFEFFHLWKTFFQELGTLILTYSKNCIYIEPDTFELEICSVFITRLAQLANNALTSNTTKHKC